MGLFTGTGGSATFTFLGTRITESTGDLLLLGEEGGTGSAMAGKATLKSRRFLHKDDAEDAIDSLDGRTYDGRELRVQMAKYGDTESTPGCYAIVRRSTLKLHA